MCIFTKSPAMTRQWSVGDRVRLIAPPRRLDFSSHIGTIIRKYRWTNHYIVRLDVPAKYDDGCCQRYLVRELNEAADNLAEATDED